MFNAKQTTLNNGIKLVTIKKETELIAVHAAIKIGAIYESESEKGISHFMEHMLFKGTKARSNEALNNELEERAGEYNAYTDSNSTVYSITSLKSELEKAVELISDMLQNSIFPDEEIEKERGVILAEIRSGRDDIEEYSYDKVHEIAFKRSPLRYNTIGDEQIVKAIDRKQLMDYYEKYYVPNNCFISIVSPYEHEKVIDIVNKYFKNWMWKEFAREKVVFEKNIPIIKTNYKKNIEQSTIVYLYTFYDLSKEDELALKILNHKFGESSNSILFREIREKRGLAYDIYTDLDLTNEVKTLIIYTAVGKNDIKETIEAIDWCIKAVKDETIKFDENTVALMKKVLNTAVAFTIEDATDIGNYVLHQIIDGDDIFQFIKDMDNLENIKEKNIYDVARKVFNNPTIHILKNQ